MVAVERGPGRVGRRDDAEAVAVVERPVGGGVVDEVHADGEVGAPAKDGHVGAFAPEGLPERDNLVADGAVAVRHERVSVEELPGSAGGVGAAAEAERVGEPEGVGSHVGEVGARLPPEELAEGSAFGNAAGIARESRGIGVEPADGVDAANGRAALAPEQDFRVAFVAERGFRELASGIERENERERFAKDAGAGAARGRDNPPDVRDAERNGMVRVEDGLPTGFSDGVREPLPPCPRNRLAGVAVVLEDVGSVAEPEEQRHGFAVLQELAVGSEELGEKAVKEGVVLAEEDLGAELERPAFPKRGRREGGRRIRRHGSRAAAVNSPDRPSHGDSARVPRAAISRRRGESGRRFRRVPRRVRP